MWFRRGLYWSKIHSQANGCVPTQMMSLFELEGQHTDKVLVGIPSGVGSVPLCLALTCPGLWLDGRGHRREYVAALGRQDTSGEMSVVSS